MSGILCIVKIVELSGRRELCIMCEIKNKIIKTILQNELSRDVKLQMCQYNNGARLKKNYPKAYTIEMDLENFDEEIFLHECMHISQFENGFPKLRTNKKTNNLETRLLCLIQDLVLDTMVNRYIEEKYNYTFKENNTKYVGYLSQLNSLNHKNVTKNICKLFAIESAYIFLNSKQSNGNDLIEQFGIRTKSEVKDMYLNILDAFSKYPNNNSESCFNIFDHIISSCKLNDVCVIS